jgi:hypothetical protein
MSGVKSSESEATSSVENVNNIEEVIGASGT